MRAGYYAQVREPLETISLSNFRMEGLSISLDDIFFTQRVLQFNFARSLKKFILFAVRESALKIVYRIPLLVSEAKRSRRTKDTRHEIVELRLH